MDGILVFCIVLGWCADLKDSQMVALRALQDLKLLFPRNVLLSSFMVAAFNSMVDKAQVLRDRVL